MSDLERDQEAWAKLSPEIQRYDRWAKGMPGDDLDGPESFSSPRPHPDSVPLRREDYEDDAETLRREIDRHYE